MSAWVLVGSPNSGKTTLYNWLTGSKFKTVNYPGATVEYSVGQLQDHLSQKVEGYSPVVIDTPGIYSLQAQSEDEKVTYGTLFEKRAAEKEINGIICVIDGTQLSRHLALAEQLKETGYPIVYVVTMVDLLNKNKMTFNVDLLRKELGGAPVVLFDGLLGAGLPQIAEEMKASQKQNVPFKIPSWDIKKQESTMKWTMSLSEKIITSQNKTNHLTDLTRKIDSYLLHPFFGIILFLVFMTILFGSIYWAAAPIMDLIDGGFGKAADFVAGHVPGLLGNFLGKGLIAAIGGVVIFIPQIFILFIGIGILESTGYLARVAALIDKPLSMVGLGGRSFVPLLSGFACAIPAIMATRNITSKKERLIAQTVIPFMTCSARLPVYALLISFLFGDEKPFVAGLIMAIMYLFALLIGAIAAGIMARLIDTNQKSRLMMELPLYRRPRFKVLLNQSMTKSKSFLRKAGPIILVLAIVLWFATNFPRPTDDVAAAEPIAAVTGGGGHSITPPSDGEVTAPKLGSTDAGTKVAGGAELPKPGEDAAAAADGGNAHAAGEVSEATIAQHSYAAQIGQKIEPVFKPLGVDWRVGFGIISAFAAREVFVSALVLVFNVEGDGDAQTQGLIKAMHEATFADGSPIFTVASVVGIFIFFSIALQCISTFAILRREAGAWTPAVLQLVLSNLGAYALAVAAVQILKAFGL